MNVSAWCIKNPVASIVFFILLTLGGLMSFGSMKVQNFPDLELPTITVTASLPGAAPAQIETEVARKIENALANLQDLKHIYTKVQDGVVNITAEFRLEKPTQEALDEVRSAVQAARGDLPAEMREPIVSKMNIAGAPVLAYAISSTKLDTEALSWFIDDTVIKQMLSVRGVGAITRVGGATRQVQVLLDPAKMQALGVTASEVSRQLKNSQLDANGGRADIGNLQRPVRIIATAPSAAALASMDIALSNGRAVRLQQIAEVRDGVQEQTVSALLDGKPVIGFEISRSKGASEIDVGVGVKAVMAAIKLAHPDIQFTQAFDFVTPAQEEYDASLKLLVEGGLLAVLVVLLFLRDLRATFVSAVALPLSVIPAFIGIKYLGFSINIVTLLALSLVIGILVDDAIVEVENIVRHLRMGKSPFEAAREAADEIGLAVIATTFTLIAVFLPTAFMAGIPGKFFKQFGWTASLAVLASLVVARMLTPMMSAYLLKPIVTEYKDPAWMRVYMRLAAWCLRWRWITLFAALAFFVGSLMLVPLLPQGFIPADDNSQSQVNVELAPGASLADTTAITEAIRSRLMKVKQVQSVYTSIGGGAVGSDPFAMSGAPETRKASMIVILSPRGQRPVLKSVIETEMRKVLEDVPGARLKVGLAGGSEKYDVVLTGDDGQALLEAARNIERDMRSIPGLGTIASSASLVRPELLIEPNPQLMAQHGVTAAALAETLRIATVGDYEQALSKLNLASRQIPIVVKLDDSVKQDLAVLQRLPVPGATGPVALGSVATLRMGSGPAVIDRYDRARNVTLSVELAGQPLGEVADKVKLLPSVVGLAPGLKIIEIGDAEAMTELFGSFLLAMGTGVLCIYLVLVLLFKDVLHPFTILAALPLSIGGAFIGLLVSNKALSMPSLIGLIMLMGVATKNSILLVEYAIIARRERGLSRSEALLDACHKRARPIIMTTIAMGAGMLPIALGTGIADPSFRSPMAISVIGGLITSTFLSLLVIPAVYTFVDDIERGLVWLFARVGALNPMRLFKRRV
jgi:multidrug efflux pump subunit AcrB